MQIINSNVKMMEIKRDSLSTFAENKEKQELPFSLLFSLQWKLYERKFNENENKSKVKT
jgi:hypothetical protein